MKEIEFSRWPIELPAKGQIISKAIYGQLTSPKNERMNLFCLLFYSSGQTNQIRRSVRFLGESTVRQSAFRN